MTVFDSLGVGVRAGDGFGRGVAGGDGRGVAGGEFAADGDDWTVETGLGVLSMVVPTGDLPDPIVPVRHISARFASLISISITLRRGFWGVAGRTMDFPLIDNRAADAREREYDKIKDCFGSKVTAAPAARVCVRVFPSVTDVSEIDSPIARNSTIAEPITGCACVSVTFPGS